jgi:hypothetical protein
MIREPAVQTQTCCVYQTIKERVTLVVQLIVFIELVDTGLRGQGLCNGWLPSLPSFFVTTGLYGTVFVLFKTLTNAYRPENKGRLAHVSERRSRTSCAMSASLTPRLSCRVSAATPARKVLDLMGIVFFIIFVWGTVRGHRSCQLCQALATVP